MSNTLDPQRDPPPVGVADRSRPPPAPVILTDKCTNCNEQQEANVMPEAQKMGKNKMGEANVMVEAKVGVLMVCFDEMD